MFNIFITLGLLLLIQIYIILFISDRIVLDEHHEHYYNLNLLKKFIEILVIILVIYYSCYFYLRNFIDYSTIIQITTLIELIVTLFWLYLNFVESEIIDYGNNNSNNSNNSNSNNSDNYNDIDFTEVLEDDNTNNLHYISNNNNILKNDANDSEIFSKYASKYKSDFTFEDLYPHYSNNNINSNNSQPSPLKDYSAYNGYSPHHLCYNCSCLKKDDGSHFCGKMRLDGSIMGCDANWKCNNCNIKGKSCQKQPGNNESSNMANNTSNSKYECKNCKCLKTTEGIVCGTITNYGKEKGSQEFVRCSDTCERCSLCKTTSETDGLETSFNTVYPSNKKVNRNNIVINNISKLDIDNL